MLCNLFRDSEGEILHLLLQELINHFSFHFFSLILVAFPACHLTQLMSLNISKTPSWHLSLSKIFTCLRRLGDY